MKRRQNPEYTVLRGRMERAKKKGDIERYKMLEKERRKIPSGDPNDPDYRRLKYVRYADDFLLGFIGPKTEAKEIKQKIGNFLRTLGLEMSEEKTLITHATRGHARFLGYNIRMALDNNQIRGGRRSINAQPVLNVPREVVQERKSRYTRHGRPIHRAELRNLSDYDIVMAYSLEFRGLVNYYTMAHNVAAKLYPLKWIYQQSLVKTLAAKHKQTRTWVYQRYKRQMNGLTAIVVEVKREGKKPLVAKFGAEPIRYKKKAVLEDLKAILWIRRNELVKRMTANRCELCGSAEDIRVHHIRKLKDLQRRYKGRPAPPEWAVRMMEMRRKTLVVCERCHRDIHAGRYDGPKLK